MPGVRPRDVPTARRPLNPSEKWLERIENSRKLSEEPFRGVATSDGVVPGLFPLRPTGISTEPVVEAARAYLDALSIAEREEGTQSMESPSWRQWSNGAIYILRHGLCLEDLSDRKRELALEVVRQSLSSKAFSAARDVMHLNYSLGILSGMEVDFDEWLYWVTIYGEPSTDGAWGWQLDGHHLNLNCAFIGDQMTLTPSFMGAEPNFVETGKYAGIRLYREEEEDALRFMQSLDSNQQSAAVFAEELPHDLFVGAYRDNFDLNYQGIPFDGLNEKQQSDLLKLIFLYVNRLRAGHSKVRMDEIIEHTDQIHFAWAGGVQNDSVFYYRVHSPVFLVEFEHQVGVVFDNDEPLRSHVHTVVRTPNGNDYGRDLLRQHHERYAHNAAR